MTWKTAAHILAVRLGGAGDVLMTTPALRALKEGRAGRRLTLLTTAAGADVAALIPEVDGTIVYDPPWMSVAGSDGAAVERTLIEQLRSLAPDAVVIFTPAGESALPLSMLCYLAGIPLRLAHCREQPHHLLTDRVQEPTPDERHDVRRQLDLVAGVTTRMADERLSLGIPADARRRVLRLLGDQRVNLERTWVAIHPGAGDTAHAFPPELVAQAARRLTRDHGWQVVFAGGAAERAQVQGIRSAMLAPSFSLAGRLSLAERAALFAVAPLVITADADAAQIAAAVGTPLITLAAPSHPHHSPWGVPARVLRPALLARAHDAEPRTARPPAGIGQIAPDALVAAAGSLLQETAGHTPAVGLGAG